MTDAALSAVIWYLDSGANEITAETNGTVLVIYASLTILVARLPRLF
jgi:hypothetical protein